jgi:hypothetical protein
MDSIFNIFLLDRIYRIMGILSPAAIHPSAEGLSILAILLILSEILLLWNGFYLKKIKFG